MKTQKHPIGNDFNAAIMQQNLTDLFLSSHDHTVRSTFPSVKEGSIADIVSVDTGTAVYICVKTSRGWFKSAALTLV